MIAVTGANGRLGAELCLRLAAGGADVVGIARNRGGSAFLRLAGVDCRHGRIADLGDARTLLADADVVVHLAYAVAGSRSVHAANVAMARNVAAAARAGAAIVNASTIMVYAPESRIRLPNVYGLEKLRLERMLRTRAHRRGLSVYTFRIGHVLGELQGLTLQIGEEIEAAAGRVALPHAGRPANTVFVAELAHAVASVARGDAATGTYDLVTTPQWSWRRVYEFYGARVDDTPAAGEGAARSAAGAVVRLVLRRPVRDRLLAVPQLLPERVGDRAYGAYLELSARRAIAASAAASPLRNAGLEWRPLPDRRPFRPAASPEQALRDYPLPPRALDLLAGS